MSIEFLFASLVLQSLIIIYYEIVHRRPEDFTETVQKGSVLSGRKSICSCHCLEGDTCHIIGFTSYPDLFPYLIAITDVHGASNLRSRLVYDFSFLLDLVNPKACALALVKWCLIYGCGKSRTDPDIYSWSC